MARSRNIKPGFFLNDQLAEIEPLGRLLFAGLWTIADREGRLEDRPKRIKVEVLPYDNCNVDHLLNELHKRNFIIRYEVDGERYIQITNWHKHQNPHCKEKKSTIPAPDLHGAKISQKQEDGQPESGDESGQEPKPVENSEENEAPGKHHTSTVQEPEKHITNPADSFNLIPDSLNLIPSSSDTQEDEVDEKKMQAIIDYYCSKKGIGEPLSPLEYQSIRNIAKKQEVTLDQVKAVVDYAVERKKRKFTFAYCETIIINRLEEEKEAANRKIVPLNRRTGKPDELPMVLRPEFQQQQKQLSPEEAEARVKALEEKIRLLNHKAPKVGEK